MERLNSDKYQKLSKTELSLITGGEKKLVGTTYHWRKIDCPDGFQGDDCYECFSIENWQETDKNGKIINTWEKKDLCSK